MLMTENIYQTELVKVLGMTQIEPQTITDQLEKYLAEYSTHFLNQSQRRYFNVYEKGLLSNLDRKTIEPIALNFLGQDEVRGLQYFFRRSTLPDANLLKQYQIILSQNIGEEDGFLSVDGSDFPKKGKNSIGVARQHCGRLGKTENCQAGVFISYATGKGYGLVDRRLYLPKDWFSEEWAKKRKQCKVPEELTFQTKNELASEMIRQTIQTARFPVKWVGCDAAFGCDHKFLKSLPDSVCYFAATKENELVFRERPEIYLPQSEPSKHGRRFQHMRPTFPPVTVKSVALDPEIPWQNRTLGEGTKGPIYAQIKCIRCVSCESSTEYGNYLSPTGDIWLYIRKYEDGTLKYFLSNAPEQTSLSTLDRLATMRWSIEQCFQECKSYLGMSHYETRTYGGWHRHMLLVMIAHLFTLVLRGELKKKRIYQCRWQNY